MREYQRKRRSVNQACKPVNCKPEDVNLPEGWDHVREHIRVPGNLAKMQAVCGALGKQDVRFGAYGPTAEAIGRVIGTRAPLVHIDVRPRVVSEPTISVSQVLAQAARQGRPERP